VAFGADAAAIATINQLRRTERADLRCATVVQIKEPTILICDVSA
jgi:hypothetical protein